MLAITAAQSVEVEEEIKFANKISTEQLRLLKENRFDSRSLPKLPETSYASGSQRSVRFRCRKRKDSLIC